MPDGATGLLENRTFNELAVGDTASLSRPVTQRDIDLFAAMTGDVNPAHLDAEYAAASLFHGIVVQGMWGAGLFSALLGNQLPGPGTIYLGQDIRFLHPVRLGDVVTATVTVREKKALKGDATLDCICVNQRGQVVITGTAFTRPATAKVRRTRMPLPVIRVDRHDGIGRLLAQAAAGPAVPTAVVHPTDAATLAVVLEAVVVGLIVPILIGPAARIRAVAHAAGVDIAGLTILDEPDGAAAAARAVALARTGDVTLLMKGALRTDALLHPVVAHGTGLRTTRRISHGYLLDVPGYPRPLLLTDMAINVAPTLAEKADIIRNAIDLAHALGIPQPRVAILAASEHVSDDLPSTLEAATLCAMAARGEITGGLLAGPLSFDCAISDTAAATKGIVSPVAGCADILVAPDLEAGNILAKALTFLAGAEAAGVVLGARVPIILASRADSARTRLASCALGVLLARVGSNR